MSFDLSGFRLNSPLGKRILAVTREGNYAHPGEEEAIVRALELFSGQPTQRWLDAGCGRGGTAAFIRQKGWAEVSAFDIDGASIGEAKSRYPEVSFYESAAEEATTVVPGRYDLIYSFNAFYAFPDQTAALRSMRALAEEPGKLVIFEYVDRGGFYEQPMTKRPEGAHWQPIDEKAFPSQLAAAGWALESVQDLDKDYARWYGWLVERFDEKRDELLALAPAEVIDYARDFYAQLLAAVEAGALGGGIFIAQTAASH